MAVSASPGQVSPTSWRARAWRLESRPRAARRPRYRPEAATLVALADKDAVLVGQADLLRSMVEGAAGDAILANKREIETGIAAISATLRDRQSFLL
ncbi:hypothetical protein EOA32_17690 [Mesorhizobium sp. M1A.F.Ca.ET.072.01.1.1]|uniref:hypothetical protein n=1 Tax=Mesorhizobium sp. M1A.F.Ca.ET.072.01.1.1 TaxID=2496753 RepID=UPI000FD2F5A2|nr:hypothetical protein [Mesorhizobium sp. M1A.F.Ca.ET.072.01.1.1]RUW50940.1 hypothetical protein EOA32_17690 [Mesorhizobium sp. M1A.F.Ca.ET.072.01.1.1]